jgi:hypothetical protein
MRTKLMSLLAVAIVGGFSALVVAQTQEFKGDSTDGWFVWDLSANQQANEKLSASEGWLRLKYSRSDIVLLGHLIPVTDLKELKVVIKSDVDAMIAFGLEDQDKARFHHMVHLPAGKETTVTMKPEDFKLNDDSPTKKEKVEPARLGDGYAVIDLGPIMGAAGENTLHIRRVTVTRGN